MLNTAPSKLARRSFLRALGLASLASGLSLSASTAPVGTGKPARSLLGPQAGFYRFRIGQFEALALLDGAMTIPASRFSGLYRGRPQETILSDLRNALEREDSLELPFNSLLVNTGADLVLVDTGAGPLYKAEGGWLQASLAAAGVKAEDISAVFLTHADFDHFGGLIEPSSGALVFKNARYFISRLEYAFTAGLSDPLLAQLPSSLKPGKNKDGVRYLRALEGRWEFVAPGDKPLPGVEVIDLKGHRPGHLGFLFESAGERLLHFGDVFHHHVLSVAHPDWTFTSDQIPEQAIDSRKRVIRLAEEQQLRLFGSHMPFPGLGRIRTRAGTAEFVRESWRSL